MEARARQEAASEALFANTAGQLCEGTGTNVFVVLDGESYTPPLSSGCLAGITRALVVEWTGARETELPMDCLERADEVFLTSSIKDVFPVSVVDGRALTAPGPVTARLRQVWAAHATQGVDP